jgi:dienelactone hydrolase
MGVGTVDAAQEGGRFGFQAWLERAYARTARPLAFRAETKEEWQRWHAQLREKVLERSGMLPPPEPCPLSPEPVAGAQEIEPGLLREKIVYQSEPGVWVPAWLLRPAAQRGRRPAVLALHGHASGGRSGADNVAGAIDQRESVAPSIARYNYDYGLQYARRGYVALCPDARTFGERVARAWTGGGGPPNYDVCDRSGNQAALLGYSLLALTVWDDARGIDVLQAREDVDLARIGVAGLSFGGTRALYLAALDDRVAAAVVSGFLTTFKSYALDRTICGAQYIPGLLRWAELPDVGALIAPRPLLIEAGLHDEHFQIAASREAHRTLERAYRLLGAAGALWRDEFDAGHRWSGRLAYTFMDRYLKKEHEDGPAAADQRTARQTR